MSSFARLMSTEAVGVGDGEVVAGGVPLQAAMRKARPARSPSARTYSGYGAKGLVGGRADLWSVLGLPLGRGGAEALVVDVLGDGRVLAADGAFRVTTQTHLAE